MPRPYTSSLHYAGRDLDMLDRDSAVQRASARLRKKFEAKKRKGLLRAGSKLRLVDVR